MLYTPAAGLDARGLPSTTWQRFNIAAHHNQFFEGKGQAFSAEVVTGSGGGSETTGYMGAAVSHDGKAIIICYDRVVSHAALARDPAMHFNTVYCFRVYVPPAPR